MHRLPSRLLARCPRTGKWLDTGVVIRDEVFDRIQRIESSVFCASCGALHRWDRRSAALEGDLLMDPEGTAAGTGAC